jgi:hypothetical protein
MGRGAAVAGDCHHLLKRLMESLFNNQVDAFFERRLEYRELTVDDENLPSLARAGR